jgi:hypothetical protein
VSVVAGAATAPSPNAAAAEASGAAREVLVVLIGSVGRVCCFFENDQLALLLPAVERTLREDSRSRHVACA